MKNISDKNCGEIKTRFFSIIFFFPQNIAVCQVVWKNIVQPERQQ
jgi:hypothetical protein